VWLASTGVINENIGPTIVKDPQGEPFVPDNQFVRRLVARISIFALAASLIVVAPMPARAAEVEGAGTVYGGMYSDQFHAENDFNVLASATGKRVTFGGTYHSVLDDTAAADAGSWSNTREILEGVWRGKATPFANLSIPASAASIAAGNRDADVRRWLDHVQLYLDKGDGRSLVLAPLQEMNGKWTPYGCDPVNFKLAFKRIRDIVRNRGIDETKIRFAFAPNGWTSHGCGSIADYYPGDSYVDVIGISAYRWDGSASVFSVMGGTVDYLSSRYPEKPILIAQTAAWPSSSKSQWIRDVFSWAASNPHVVGIIYFNFDNSNVAGETDWRVWINPSVNAGWKDGMLFSSTDYKWPLTDWFKKGPLKLVLPPGINLCPDGKDCDTVALQDSGGLFNVYTYATSGKAVSSFYYGNPGDVPFSGDWDCDGVETLGLYRRSDGYVYLRNSNTAGVADISFYFGNPGDYPVAGDFNGNGCDTVSIYRPSEARFYIINKLGSNDGGLGAADYSFLFGDFGDKPFIGDFNGDGVDTVGLHRESTGLVYFRNTNSTGVADFQFIYGNPGDLIVAGDWNGDGDDTVGVYRPADRMIYLRNSNTAGYADSQVYAGSYTGIVAIDP
jgi:hypothetical protein